MKYKALLFSIILLLSFSIIPSIGKIQLNDVWQYEDDQKMIYNETAISNIQIISGRTAISAMLVNTSRGFSFPYDFKMERSMNGTYLLIDFLLSPNITGLYVTQEKGMVLFPKGNFYGEITTTIGNNRQNFNVVDSKFIMRSGDPSLSFVSSSSEKYMLETQFSIVSNENFDTILAWYAEEYIISTNQDFDDNIKNFTYTKNFVHFSLYAKRNGNTVYSITITEYLTGNINYELKYNGETLMGDIPSKTPSLSSLFDVAYEITLDKDYNMPTYIRQVEPVKVKNKLALNQFTSTIVEYFLITNVKSNIKSNKEGISILSFDLIFIVYIILTLKRSRWFDR